MGKRALVSSLILTGIFTTAGCADPARAPDAGVLLDAETSLPNDASVMDAGVTGQVQIRAIGLGPSGGTATSTTYRVTGEIGQPTSSGRASGPNHTVVGGAGRPDRP